MATTFRDSQNRTWDLALTHSTATRLRNRLEVKLYDGQQIVEQLLGDTELLVNTIYVTCQPQCDAAGVTDEDFGAAMGGDAIAEATAAFLEAFVNFSPPAKRQVLQNLLTKTRELEARQAKAAQRRLDSGVLDTLAAKAEEQTDAMIQKMIQKQTPPPAGSTSGSSSTTPPAAAASNPDR